MHGRQRGFTLLELLTERVVGLAGEGRDQEPARLAVEAVQQAVVAGDAELLESDAPGPLAAGEEAVEERVVVVALARLRDEPVGFVED